MLGALYNSDKLLIIFMKVHTVGEDPSMDDSELRKKVLSGKKTDRIIFAVTPEMKSAIETVAQEKCVSVSALLTSLSLAEIIKNKDLFEHKGA